LGLERLNPVAILWTALGFLIYTWIIPVGMMKTVSTVLICEFGYCITVWLVSAFWPALARASLAGEQRETVEQLAWHLAER
jgi:hypothetical protein